MFFIRFWANGGTAIFLLIAVGGLCYSVGAVIYGLKRPDPRQSGLDSHEIFHSFTLGGYVSHYVGICLAIFGVGVIALGRFDVESDATFRTPAKPISPVGLDWRVAVSTSTDVGRRPLLHHGPFHEWPRLDPLLSSAGDHLHSRSLRGNRCSSQFLGCRVARIPDNHHLHRSVEERLGCRQQPTRKSRRVSRQLIQQSAGHRLLPEVTLTGHQGAVGEQRIGGTRPAAGCGEIGPGHTGGRSGLLTIGRVVKATLRASE